MTNHVHLLLDPGDDLKSIGLLMKRLAGRQTRYVNKQEHRTGSLWEGRKGTGTDLFMDAQLNRSVPVITAGDR
jgi:REP element-mobilizing transposase RayT